MARSIVPASLKRLNKPLQASRLDERSAQGASCHQGVHQTLQTPRLMAEAAAHEHPEPNTRRQVVALLDWVEASVLDSGKVEIVLGEQITETGSRDKYFIRAALCRDPACKSKIARWAPCRGAPRSAAAPSTSSQETRVPMVSHLCLRLRPPCCTRLAQNASTDLRTFCAVHSD